MVQGEGKLFFSLYFSLLDVFIGFFIVYVLYFIECRVFGVGGQELGSRNFYGACILGVLVVDLFEAFLFF